LSHVTFIVACLALAACPSGQNESGKTHLRFSGYAGNPAETDLVKKLVAEFNAAHDDIEVSYEPVPGQYVPKILTMLVANTAPDVFYLDIAFFKPFLQKNVLRPLDDYLARAGIAKEEFLPRLVEGFSDKGTLYGIPKDFNAYALFYNKDIFDEQGLDYPDASWDLERLRATAKKLTKPGRAGFVLTHDTCDRYLPVARMYGARLFTDAGRVAIDSPEAREALRFYAGLKRDDHAAIYPSEVGTSQVGDAFGRGLAAMAFEGSWIIPYLKSTYPNVRYGVAPLPRGPVGRSNFLFTVAYVIPKGSKNPDAAWKLIEHLTSPKSQAQVTFALPSRRAEADAYVAERPPYRPVLEGAAYAQPYDFGPKGDRVKSRLGVMVQEVFLGAKDADTALRDAARDIERLGAL
jgi:multiple sugar transport system substrate-binding protein